MGKQPALKRGKLLDIGHGLLPRHVRVAAHGAGRRTGGVKQHGVEQFSRPAVEHVGLQQFRRQAEALQVLLQPGQPVLRGVDSGDVRACEDELRRLAAGSGAKIGDT